MSAFPAVQEIEMLQEQGVNIYVWGVNAWSALVVDVDNDRVTVVHLSARSLGRWECTPAHLHAYTDVYLGRFPERLTD